MARSIFTGKTRHGLFHAAAEICGHILAVFVDSTPVLQLHRHTGHRQTARYLRTDGNNHMPLEEIQNRLTAVVAAVIFAISPQKTGTHCDFHKYPPS